MLPRRWHLVKEGDFTKVYRRGRRLRMGPLVVWGLSLPGTTPTRLAVVVSSKVSAKATKRNLIRRRLWAALRQHQALLPTQGLNLVISAQKPSLDLAYMEILNEVEKIIRSFNRNTP